MTTKAGVGFSQKVNSREAGIEATQTAMAEQVWNAAISICRNQGCLGWSRWGYYQ